MFFWISKLAAPLLYPLTHIFLLLLIALFFYRKPKLGRVCLGLALFLLMLFGTYPLPDMMMTYLETRYVTTETPPHVDAIVVLTGVVNLSLSTPEHIEFYDGVERILTGIELIKNGYSDKLLIAGGSGNPYDQTKSEARILGRFAIELGIPKEKILLDPSSRNTYENAVNTKTIMEEQGISSIILVTSAAHLPRAMACFKKVGLHPIPYGVDYNSPPDVHYHFYDIIPSVGALRKTSHTIHEYIGLLMYKISGYI